MRDLYIPGFILGALLIETTHLVVHLDGGGQRIIRSAGEQSHHRVADVFIDIPTMLMHNRSDLFKVVIDKAEDLLRAHLFGDGGERADIAEHHRRLLLYVIAQPQLKDTLFVEGGEDLFRHKAAVGFGKIDLLVVSSSKLLAALTP